MRERLDCAVMLTRCTLDWVEPLLGQHAGGRLYLHGLEPLVDIEQDGALQALGAMSMALRRYDACLLPVWPATLSWARTSLSQALPKLQTPVLALVRELTAAGLFDLHDLGVSDFVRHPLCTHEVRLRIERLLDGRRAYNTNPHESHRLSESTPNGAAYPTEPAENTAQSGWDIESYAIAAASRCSSTSESFQQAKKNVVVSFERAYLNASLSRHGGNIAMAARAAKKHRRAFWALMRKHSIDAEPFRKHAGSSYALPGPAANNVRRQLLLKPTQTRDCALLVRTQAERRTQSDGEGKIG